MPKLTTTDYKCFLCGNQAFYISFNSKQPRCVEKITRCPGHSKKAQKSRDANWTIDERNKHMKVMSLNGNDKLKELHKDSEWRKQKGNNISKSKSIIPEENLSLWKLYENKVDRITRDSWIYFHSIINPNNLQRGKEYELDHKFSKQAGFINNIPPEIIGHYSNLELVPRYQNRKKHNKCSITIDMLYSGINSIIPSDSPSSDTIIS